MTSVSRPVALSDIGRQTPIQPSPRPLHFPRSIPLIGFDPTRHGTRAFRPRSRRALLVKTNQPAKERGARKRCAVPMIASGKGAWVQVCPMLSKYPVMLTPDEVAEVFRTSRAVIYEMVRLGKLPGVIHIGRKLLVRRDRLLEVLRERESSVTSLGGEA